MQLQNANSSPLGSFQDDNRPKRETCGGDNAVTAARRGILSTYISKKVIESLERAQRAVKLPEGMIRPKAEQDMVGFGLREMIGLPMNKIVYPSSDTQMVYYATNRECEGEDDHGLIFGKKPDSRTHLGIAEIQCPNGKPLVHREAQATHPMSSDEFKESLKQQIAEDKNKAVLVYVHGCFTDFGRGVGYGAYILRGLEFQGPMVVYSWPTVGRPSVREGLVKAVELYRQDEGTCKASAESLKDLLRFLSKDLGAESVHVVAYSMGARTLIEAMRLFEPDDDLPVTSHLYFIAPDVAAHLFSETLRDFRFPTLNRVHAKHEGPSTSGCEASEGSQGAAHVARADESGAAGASSDDLTPDVAAIMHDMVERVADAWNFVGDSVAGLRQLAQAWREARMTGWHEMQENIEQHWEDREAASCEAEVSHEQMVERIRAGGAAEQSSVDDNSQEEAVKHSPHLRQRRPMRSAHVHLYAASNDIALLLSELTDPGVPKIRAGRTTKDFMLCNDFFNTVDVTSLKTGILSTGHFYLFHDVVKEEMAHVLSGRQGDAWWRQGMEWENGTRYLRLRATHPVQQRLLEQAKQQWKASSECTMQPKIETSPIYWACP